MKIYTALAVPEVWRFDGVSLYVHLLGANGKFKESATSRAFPMLPISEVERFLQESDTTEETTLLHSFSKWVREAMVPSAGKAKKNGKKSAK